MNPQASKSHWQAVAQLMQLHAEAELAESFQRVPQHLNQPKPHSPFLPSIQPPGCLQDALRVRMQGFPRFLHATGALCHVRAAQGGPKNQAQVL